MSRYLSGKCEEKDHVFRGENKCQCGYYTRNADGTLSPLVLKEPILFPREYVANVVHAAALSLSRLERPIEAYVPVEIYEAIDRYDIRLEVRLIPKIDKKDRVRQMFEGKP